MGKKKEFTIKSIKLEKLVHGGQAIAMLDNGKKLFAWGGLPGETVAVRVLKQKKTYVEGVVVDVLEASKDRVEPEETEVFLSTSPWQIMSFSAENKAKQAILIETFEREGVENITFHDFVYGDEQYAYRNKMEFGFWGDENGLHLANYVRGTHGKAIVEGSSLAYELINVAARDVRDELNRLEIWGGKLKTVVLRCSRDGEVVAALFAKEEIDLVNFKLPSSLKGLDVYYSNPKSPASVATKKIYSYGEINLHDSINTKHIIYDVLSFFQVNISVFELALEKIKTHITGKNVVDMYSGVGTIGIAVGANILVESDGNNVKMAEKNAEGLDIEVIQATSETALDTISPKTSLIVDPPRAGLHKDLISHINQVKPSQIIYLSCNPSTQARDVKLLEENYKISYAQGFNFFPRTPHIESLLFVFVYFMIVAIKELFIPIFMPALDRKIELEKWRFKKKLLTEKEFKVDGKDYNLKVFMHRKNLTSKMIQILIGTPGALPEILLDSNDLVASLYSEKHEDVKRFQFQSFEGDMDLHFKIFTPNKLKLEATQVLSPDVLIIFRDKFSDYDILISDGTIDMRKSGTANIDEITKDSEYLIKKIARFYKYSKVQTMIDSVSNKLVK
jgi:23S rRNA (uracil1939-C5)-methyltransferase